MAAKYQILADDLLEKILNGEYPIGSVIPPESKLQEIYQVSRHTVRQALSLLIQQGYLKAEKGSGTFVLNYKDTSKNKTQATKTIGVITTYLSDYIFPTIKSYKSSALFIFLFLPLISTFPSSLP